MLEDPVPTAQVCMSWLTTINTPSRPVYLVFVAMMRYLPHGFSIVCNAHAERSICFSLTHREICKRDLAPKQEFGTELL